MHEDPMASFQWLSALLISVPAIQVITQRLELSSADMPGTQQMRLAAMEAREDM